MIKCSNQAVQQFMHKFNWTAHREDYSNYTIKNLPLLLNFGWLI